MSLQYMAIDKDIDLHKSESDIWLKRGVLSTRVDTIDEGIQCAMKNEFIQ